MYKKLVAIILLIIIISTVLYFITYKIYYRDLAKQEFAITLTIEDIKLQNISDSTIYLIGRDGSYHSQKLSNVDEIVNYPENYKELTLSYRFKNISNVKLYDVFFTPNLNKELRNRVIAFEKNIGYPRGLSPDQEDVFRQQILVKLEGISDNDFLNEVKKGTVEVDYLIQKKFIAPFSRTKEFKIELDG